MKDEIISSKKDIILLMGQEDLKIDAVAQVLLRYFDEYEYFPRKYLERNSSVSSDDLINEYSNDDKKLIISSLSYYNSETILKILFTSSQYIDTKILQYDYDCVIDLDKQNSEEKIVEEIIVTWGHWIRSQ